MSNRHKQTHAAADDGPVVVIFRRWPPSAGGEVIALFPTLPATVDGRYCTSYQHAGQHSAADYNRVVTYTRPATEDEAAPLRRELEMIGYRLIVRRRYART